MLAEDAEVDALDAEVPTEVAEAAALVAAVSAAI